MADNETAFKIPFVKKEQVALDTYTFYFERSDVSRDFVAGQYFEIKLRIKNTDERGDTNVFSMSSSPTEKDYYAVTTKVVKSSFKKSLLKLKEGTLVQFNGPWDDLNFNENDDLRQVFMAGGIGITPFRSIVKYAIDKKLDLPITLFASWGSKEEMVFDEFFRSAEKKLKDFRYVPTVTYSDDLKGWDGETGRISERLVKKYIKKVRNNRFRISGPVPLVKAMRELAVQMNVPKDNIIVEEFEGY